MHRLTVAVAVAVALALAPAAPALHAQVVSTPAPIVLHCGHLVDTVAGRLRGETTIVIDGKRFREVRAGRIDIPGAQAIELAKATCLPGLIDSHTHLTSETSPTGYTDQFRWNPADYAIRSTVYARRTLQAGFTTVRNTHAAELLKQSKDLGSVEAGKLADVIAVEGNPLDDIRLMQKVEFVMKEGVVYRRDGQSAGP